MADAEAQCLPITEIFARSRTHEERARWLLSAPLDVILRDHRAISEICGRADFRLGVTYVSVELAALMAVRRRGWLPLWHRSMVLVVRAEMRREARYLLASKPWFYRWKCW
jgi:hypothetical protein